MGGHAYWYFVSYEKDVSAALAALRRREFEAGRYNPVLRHLRFREPAFSQQCPGAQHASIEDAQKAAAEEGTRSILDIEHVAARRDHGVAAPISEAELRDRYGTTKPTRKMLEGLELIADVERGHCLYVVVYDGDRPTELFFGGYSYD